MVIRTIANKTGTIEINGNSYYFLQPLSSFKTDELEQIHQAYEKRLLDLRENEHYLTARDITFQSGQVRFEYDVTELKSFDYLKSLYLEDKLPYYLSLFSIAKNEEAEILWQKENFMVDTRAKDLRTAIVGNDVLELHNPKSKIEMVKELIIVSLTHLNRVLGRPRRSDFFEQEEEVIQFAETIYLRLNTLEEMEAYIANLYHEVLEKKYEAEQLALQNKEKKRFQFLPGISFLQKGDGKQGTPRRNNGAAQKSKPAASSGAKGSNLRLLIGAGLILLAALVLNLVLTNANKEAEGRIENPEAVAPQEKGLNYEELYRQGLLGDRQSVIAALESVDYESLEEEDRNVLTALYLETGDYQSAVEKQPELAGQIAADLAGKNKLEELLALQDTLEESDPAVNFEVAAIQEDWPTVIELRNAVELSDSRNADIVTAYIRTGDLQAAKRFVSEKADADEELLNRILGMEKLQTELAALKEEQVQQQAIIEKNPDQKKVEAAAKRLTELEAQIKKVNESIMNG